MKKTIWLVAAILLMMLPSCQSKTKTPQKTILSFQGEALGIDLLPQLAEMNLRLTIGMIQNGFLVAKQSNVVAIQQLSPLELSIEEINRIQTKQLDKWHIAVLPYQSTIEISSPVSRTYRIEKYLIKDSLKSSPVILALSRGLEEKLASTLTYQGKGYLTALRHQHLGNDIKIQIEVVLVDHDKP